MSVKAVLYVRVSDERQLDGYSPEVQEREGENYAARHGLEIVRRWVVSESAKQAGRMAFGEMISLVKSDATIKAIIFEKTDRSTRNFHDVDQLYRLIEVNDKELHFYKTGLVLNRQSRSSDKLRFDIEAVLARNYINNLSEEVRKGMDEKVKKGGWPSIAPVGYYNDAASRDVLVDEKRAPLVRQLFELYSTGRYALDDLVEMARNQGLQHPMKHTPFGKGGIYHMLSNPFYCGIMSWKGESFVGKHQALISKGLYDRVQQCLGRKKQPKNRRFAFKGFATCGHCGSAITAEYHMKRWGNNKSREYVHYRCTGWRNGGKVCGGSRISEPDLLDQLGECLKELTMNKVIVEEIKVGLQDSFSSERDYHKARMGALQEEATRTKNWLDKAYTDRLEGLITPEEFREKSSQWRERQLEIQNEVRGHTVADGKYLEEGERILDLAQRAHAIYQEETDNFKRRRLIDLVVSKVTITDKRALSETWEPFSALSKVAVAAISSERGSLWWAVEDLNL